jgi:hypothetical protein
MNKISHIYLLLIIACPYQYTAAADHTGRYVSVISENDVYAPRKQDRHYTNGARLAMGLDGDNMDSWYRFMDRFPLPRTGTEIDSYEFAVGHNIYTPEFFISPDPVLHDRPFAGWLYTELSRTVNSPGREQSLAISLGVVGPLALGEEVQKLYHSIIGDLEPLGWDHQLKNEPAVLLRYRHSWFTPLVDGGRVKLDLITRAGINLGNVFTDAGTGLALRLGNHLPERELPLRLQPGLSGNNTFIHVRKDRFDWMVFAGVQGRGIARNIFLDGNTFRDSHSVDKRPLIWDAEAGIILGFGQFRHPVFISISFVWRDREFDLQQGRDNLGSAMVGIQY